MQPTESETTVAMHAAAARAYENWRLDQEDSEEHPIWANLEATTKHAWLDAVSDIVWAALQAVPDRLFGWRQLVDEVDPNDIRQLQDFLQMIKDSLGGSPR